ncbi:DnaJ C-terminal domain-containing protein [Lacinutrix chionoecetis]
MKFIDYYKILGLTKDASEKDIKKAYRKLARKYHPDLNPDDKVAEQKFKEINEANEVLSHPDNRKKYDEYGKDWQHADTFKNAKKQQQYGGSQRSTGGTQFEGDFSSFFENMFGGGDFQSQRRQAQFRGQDYNADLQLDIKDVYTTHKRTLTINGKNIRITVPAGVEDGQKIKISGHGGQGLNGGPNGDLYLKFNIRNQTNFKRNKENLYTSVDLDVYTALLGGDIMVDTFNGKVKLTVKPETENGTKVKLKGKGFPKYKKEGEFGDLFITYTLKIPKNLSKEEKELIEKLKKLR